jgi:DNA polymerase
MNETTDIGGRLAALAAKLRGAAQAQARATPDARVRLARPLDAPAAVSKVDALLGLDPALVGGARPQAPFAPGLAAFGDQIAECQLCPLGGKRKRMVFGEGAPHAALAFVGSFPGGDEELTGKPFAGAGGELLERMVAAMGYKRAEVYVCNVLKCRHHGAKDPDPADIAACRPFLEHQLRLVGPQVVIALGETAAHFLLGAAQPLGSLRGRWGAFEGMKVMPTFHPSDLLRDPGLKRHVWDDMKLVMQALKGQASR